MGILILYLFVAPLIMAYFAGRQMKRWVPLPFNAAGSFFLFVALFTLGAKLSSGYFPQDSSGPSLPTVELQTVAQGFLLACACWLCGYLIMKGVAVRSTVSGSDNSTKKIITRHYGGIYKRIDENRELLELLQEQAPDLLQNAPWVEGWLDTQDRFLIELAEATKPDDSRLSSHFPRPWPSDQKEAHAISAQADAVGSRP